MSQKVTKKSIKRTGRIQHGIRFLRFIDVVLNVTGSASTVFGLIEDTGRRHSKLPGMKSNFISHMGVAFAMAMKKQLKRQWDDDIQAAWEDIFGIVNEHFSKGLRTGTEDRQRQLDADSMGIIVD